VTNDAFGWNLVNIMLGPNIFLRNGLGCSFLDTVIRESEVCIESDTLALRS